MELWITFRCQSLREKILARCDGIMEFAEHDWGDLVECVVVKPDTLTFELK